MTTDPAVRADERYEHLLEILRRRPPVALDAPADLTRRAFAGGDGAPEPHIRHALVAKGKFSRSLSVYELTDPESGRRLGTTVEKVLTRPPAGDREEALWLQEPLFYAELADRLAVDGLKIPNLHDVKVTSRNEVALYLEHIKRATPIRSMAGREHAALAFGRMAGRAHADKADTLSWLTPSAGIGSAAFLDRAIELVGLLPADAEEKDAIAAALRSLFDVASDLRKTYRQCLPTLSHGDANHLNVLGREVDSGTEVVVVDWARVHSGRIGDDLARIAMPWLVSDSGARSEDELRRLESKLVDRYEEGVRDFVPTIELASLRFAYDLRSVMTTAGLSPYLTKSLERGEQSDERGETLLAWFRVIAERANSLRARAGAQRTLTNRYMGSGASTYNSGRSKEARWRREHEAVRGFLSRYPGSRVFDCPVGTGRFVPLYREFGCRLIGGDISSDMLAEAESEAIAHDYTPERLAVVDATAIDAVEFACDVAVAVRFFNWLPPAAAAQAFSNIAATANQAMIMSLTSVDLDQVEEHRRESVRERMARVHLEPQENGKPPNGSHRWDHFQAWVREAGFEVAESEEIVRGKGRWVNHIHLLTRKATAG